MKSKDRIIIQKIISYIDDVQEYIKELDAKEFLDDKKTITACAFTVSQIGELVKEITDETIEKYSNIPWKSIKNIIINICNTRNNACNSFSCHTNCSKINRSYTVINRQYSLLC